MLANEYLEQWIVWLISLVGTGAVLTITYFAFSKITNPEDAETYNKKIKKTIKATIILVCIPTFIDFIKRYF